MCRTGNDETDHATLKGAQHTFPPLNIIQLRSEILIWKIKLRPQGRPSFFKEGGNTKSPRKGVVCNIAENNFFPTPLKKFFFFMGGKWVLFTSSPPWMILYDEGTFLVTFLK